MRLVRRALTGAAASLALGALFTGVAVGAEPTNAEAGADTTVIVGLGGDGDPTVDVDLDGTLGGTAEPASTEAVADLGGDAALGGSLASATDGTVVGEVAIGTATDADAASATDGDASIDLGASQASLAGAGMNAGSLMNIDLDAGRDGAGGSGTASATLGAVTDAADGSGPAGDGAASLTRAAGSGPAEGVSTAVGSATDPVSVSPGAVSGVNLLGFGGFLGQGQAPVVGGDDPSGGEADAATADGTEPTGLSLPDTAIGAVGEVAVWGLLVVVLAGLLASARRLAAGR